MADTMECQECRDMMESGEFTQEEIDSYHNGDLTIESFNKRQQAIIRDVFDKYDNADIEDRLD